MVALKQYANSKGIQIIGDIPIFVSFDSADAWSEPELFHFNKKRRPTAVAGVPPDYFSPTGQLWGNPLYRWNTHKKDGYIGGSGGSNPTWRSLTSFDWITFEVLPGTGKYLLVCPLRRLENGSRDPGIHSSRRYKKSLGETSHHCRRLG